MYVIDLTHCLDEKGTMAPQKGTARKNANFLTTVVARASDFERPSSTPGPFCFKCRKQDQSVVDTAIDTQWRIVWCCTVCHTEGQISIREQPSGI